MVRLRLVLCCLLPPLWAGACAPECDDDFDCLRADNGDYTACVDNTCVPLDTVPSENTCASEADCDFGTGAGSCEDGFCIRRPVHQLIYGDFLYLAQCTNFSFDGTATSNTDATDGHRVTFILDDVPTPVTLTIGEVEVADMASIVSIDDTTCTGVWAAASQSAVFDSCTLAFGGADQDCSLVLVSQARKERPCEDGTCPDGATCNSLLEQNAFGTCDCPEDFCGELDPDPGAADAGSDDAGVQPPIGADAGVDAGGDAG